MLNKFAVPVLVTLCFLANTQCGISTSIASDMGWENYARRYLALDNQLASASSLNQKDAFRILQEREDAKEGLIGSAAPTEEEIIAFLKSEDAIMKEIALVNLMHRWKYSDRVSEQVVRLANENGEYILRFYCFQVLRGLDARELRNYESTFIQMAERIREEGLIISVIPILVKLDTPDSAFAIEEIFRGGTNTVKGAIWFNVKDSLSSTLRDIKGKIASEVQ